MSRLIEVEHLDLVDALAAETRRFVNSRLDDESQKMRCYVDERFNTLQSLATKLRNAPHPRLRVVNG
jgi:hypothetical protein